MSKLIYEIHTFLINQEEMLMSSIFLVVTHGIYSQ